MATELQGLAQRFHAGDATAQPSLSIKCHIWRMGAQGVLEKIYPEKVEWFERCYGGDNGMHRLTTTFNIRFDLEDCARDYRYFMESFATARGLLQGSLERLKSLELDTLIQLSSVLVSDEFETALQLFDTSKGDESILRAAGTVARVALERHLFTIAEARNVTIEVNPPNKKKAEAQDVLNSLAKASVITAIQKSALETLFLIGNHCAHPKESIKAPDVQKLIVHGKEMAATIV